jgi:hypothetical protein
MTLCCERVKANHLRPAENLHPLSIPKWKWEDICMDFIVDLPEGDPWFLPLGHIEGISPGDPIHVLLIVQLSNISVGLLTK